MKKRLLVYFLIVLLVSLPFSSASIIHSTSKETVEIKEIQEQESIEEKPTSVRTTSYYYGTGLIAKEENNEISYYHKDNLGSTRAVTDKDGNKKEEIDYMPYGEVLNSNSETFTFTGKELDSSGLSYFGARYYDSSIGRFITVDPIGSGVNWYSYANNNPLKYVDPNGLEGAPADATSVYVETPPNPYTEPASAQESAETTAPPSFVQAEIGPEPSQAEQYAHTEEMTYFIPDQVDFIQNADVSGFGKAIMVIGMATDLAGMLGLGKTVEPSITTGVRKVTSKLEKAGWTPLKSGGAFSVVYKKGNTIKKVFKDVERSWYRDARFPRGVRSRESAIAYEAQMLKKLGPLGFSPRLIAYDSRTITMALADGTALSKNPTPENIALARKALTRLHLAGFTHGDPHGNNIFISRNKVTFIDLGFTRKGGSIASDWRIFNSQFPTPGLSAEILTFYESLKGK